MSGGLSRVQDFNTMWFSGNCSFKFVFPRNNFFFRALFGGDFSERSQRDAMTRQMLRLLLVAAAAVLIFILFFLTAPVFISIGGPIKGEFGKCLESLVISWKQNQITAFG